MIKSYKDLQVWQKTIDLTEKVYLITESFPKEEAHGLTSQIRRSVVSISSNIAEGRGRSTRKDFISFLYNSLGSSFELETQLEISRRLNFISEDDHRELSNSLIEIIKMLHGMINKLKARS